MELEERLRELQHAIDNVQMNVADGHIGAQAEVGRRFQFGGVHADATRPQQVFSIELIAGQFLQSLVSR